MSLSPNEERGMRSAIKNFLKDEGGATAIEYALIATMMGVGVLAALYAVRAELRSTFSEVQTELNSATQ